MFNLAITLSSMTLGRPPDQIPGLTRFTIYRDGVQVMSKDLAASWCVFEDVPEGFYTAIAFRVDLNGNQIGNPVQKSIQAVDVGGGTYEAPVDMTFDAFKIGEVVDEPQPGEPYGST